jgi:hypothetical protein
MRSRFRPERGGWAGLLLAVALTTACGAVAGSPSAATAQSSASATPSGPAPSGQPATPPGQRPPLHTPPTDQRVLVARDQDNGHAMSLQVGDQLELVLTSTYWKLDGSSDAAVLRQTLPPVVAPQPSGCVVGQGCGTVTAHFQAIARGQADVSARRTSCGEAMSCTGNLGFYRLTVMVTG